MFNSSFVVSRFCVRHLSLLMGGAGQVELVVEIKYRLSLSIHITASKIFCKLQISMKLCI